MAAEATGDRYCHGQVVLKPSTFTWQSNQTVLSRGIIALRQAQDDECDARLAEGLNEAVHIGGRWDYIRERPPHLYRIETESSGRRRSL
jgi:hypothetical protein